MIMYFIAIVGDFVSIFQVTNVAESPITLGALWLAGKSEGIDIFGSGNFGWTFTTALSEFMVGTSIFPGWTTRVYFLRKKAKADKLKGAA